MTDREATIRECLEAIFEVRDTQRSRSRDPREFANGCNACQEAILALAKRIKQ